jgi:hypothetical protein
MDGTLDLVASTDDDHASRAPSGAKIWFNCPGSIKATKHVRQDDNEAALVGTAVHKLIEACLRHNINADNYLGATFKITGRTKRGKEFVLDVEITREEVDCANTAIQFVRPFAVVEPLEVERRVDGRPFGLDTFGTVDIGGCADNHGGVLFVADYKHGFLDVPVEGNHQAYIYALLRLLEWRRQGREFEHVYMAIIQPRSIAVGPRVKTLMVPTAHVWGFEPILRAAIARTYEENAPLVYGEHCRYCPGLGLCAASSGALDGLAAQLVTDPAALSTDQLGALWQNKKLVEQIFKRAEKELMNRMLAGQSSAGLKLVTGTKHRKWRDEGAVRRELVAKIGPDALKPPTPAQVEDLGDIGKDIVARFAFLPPGEPTIALENDKRAGFVPKSPLEIFGPPVNS